MPYVFIHLMQDNIDFHKGGVKKDFILFVTGCCENSVIARHPSLRGTKQSSDPSTPLRMTKSKDCFVVPPRNDGGNVLPGNDAPQYPQSPQYPHFIIFFTISNNNPNPGFLFSSFHTSDKVVRCGRWLKSKKSTCV